MRSTASLTERGGAVVGPLSGAPPSAALAFPASSAANQAPFVTTLGSSVRVAPFAPQEATAAPAYELPQAEARFAEPLAAVAPPARKASVVAWLFRRRARRRGPSPLEIPRGDPAPGGGLGVDPAGAARRRRPRRPRPARPTGASPREARRAAAGWDGVQGGY